VPRPLISIHSSHAQFRNVEATINRNSNSRHQPIAKNHDVCNSGSNQTCGSKEDLRQVDKRSPPPQREGEEVSRIEARMLYKTNQFSRWYPAEDEIVKKTVSDPILKIGKLSFVKRLRVKETGVCDRICFLQDLRSAATHLQQSLPASL